MTQKIAICAPSHDFAGMYLCIFATKAYISNMSSTCLHNKANFGPLTAEIGSGVLGTPANFNGFRVLPSLLQCRRSLEANQTVHNVWRSPGLVHYYIHFRGLWPPTEFCPVQNSFYAQVLLSPILAALLHDTPAARQPDVATSYMEWNYGTFVEGATYIRQGDHHVAHRPTF